MIDFVYAHPLLLTILSVIGLALGAVVGIIMMAVIVFSIFQALSNIPIPGPIVRRCERLSERFSTWRSAHDWPWLKRSREVISQWDWEMITGCLVFLLIIGFLVVTGLVAKLIYEDAVERNLAAEREQQKVEDARLKRACDIGYKVFHQDGRRIDYWGWDSKLQTVQVDSAKEQHESKHAHGLHGTSTWLRGKDIQNPRIVVIHYK